MKSLSLSLTCGLLVYYGIAQAHVVDIHPRTPSEEREMELSEKEMQNERDREILQDDTKSDEERREALARLVENEGIV